MTITPKEITKPKTDLHLDNSRIMISDIENVVKSQLNLRTQQIP
ncbi:2527_t:CDS:1, partial [Racocetra persica]